MRRLRVSGRVQGVGFRWFVREQARALGLRGWVRNEASGDVLLEVAGSEEQVAMLFDVVQQGPSGSRVDAVRDEPPEFSSLMLPMPFTVHR